ncbi:hypothetical protein FRC10_010570 [Ceratobasidium sp. 414]|nr:hypothetical protein FRC10_010570 [Ceratobasidium sp. 414]
MAEYRRWIFERIGDDTGGEAADAIKDEVERLKRELEAKSEQFAKELAKKDQQLAEQARTISVLTTALHQVRPPGCTTGRMAESCGKLGGPRGTERGGEMTANGLGPNDTEQASLVASPVY